MATNQIKEEIRPITMPGVHSRFLRFFKEQSEPGGLRILDVGAGEGALTQKLHDMGYRMQACDFSPESFKFNPVQCDEVDITLPFPYEDHSFDRVIAVEVTEHILDHENFFREVYRILKPGGKLYVSTPNILSMKSRLRFLFQGFPYGFKPLDMNLHDGMQHVASLSLDQYNYLALKNGFREAEYAIDRKQNTSRWLRIIFSPLMFLSRILKGYSPVHNRKELLLGRLLFMVFRKL
ncbi:MAG: class I SAM-dependent methyltransferase [Bacteroidales bacterium]|nr:class I SAM-dependent methyltransferase [Bacteroidales bacterium]